MSGVRPESVLDPVCGMTVNVIRAEEAGLTVEHESRTYAFCRSGCRRVFEADPATYAAQADAASAETTATPLGMLVIDDGMRRWYENCSCCLSDAYPEIKAALDAERAAQQTGPVAAGICEVAEAPETLTTVGQPQANATINGEARA